MFEKYDDKIFSLPFTGRRELDKCYRQWNIEDPPGSASQLSS